MKNQTNDNQILLQGIKILVEEGHAFDFLRHEEAIYSKEDIKEPETSLSSNRRER